MTTTADQIEKIKEEEQEIERVIAEKRAKSLQNGDSQYLHTSIIVESFVTKLTDENRAKGQRNPYFSVDQNLIRMAESVERKFGEKTPNAA